MMNYDEFKGSIQDQIKDFLPEKYEDADVKIREVLKNNDTILDGLTVVGTDSNISRACQLKCVSFLFPLVFKGCSVDGADRYSGHF